MALNLPKLGLPILAIIELEHIGGRTCEPVVADLIKRAEIVECYRETGSDAVILKVIATSIDHLAKVIDDVSVYGVPKTSIIRSRPYTYGLVTPEALAFEQET